MTTSNNAGAHGGIVRRLDASDAAAYRMVMLDAYAMHPSAFTSTVQEREGLPLRWWEERLGGTADAAEASVVYGAFDDTGVLVGAAGLSFGARQRERHKATLFGMTVAASARRSGFGRRLVLALLDHARARGGLRLVQLTVTEGNASAQSFMKTAAFAASAWSRWPSTSMANCWARSTCGATSSRPIQRVRRSTEAMKASTAEV